MASPPSASSGGASSAATVPAKQSPQTVSEFLNSQAGTLYGIFDAAQGPPVLDCIRSSGVEHRSLYDGKSAEDLEQFAPYLVRFPKDGVFLSEILSSGWGKNWGVFLATGDDMNAVRGHLRQFLMVTLPDAKNAYFRFYDPRVMRKFVTGFDAAEAARFFGSIHDYFCEDDKPGSLLRLWAGPSGVERESIPVRTG
jgi:hypothetical protein